MSAKNKNFWKLTNLSSRGTKSAQDAELEVISVNKAAMVEHNKQTVHGSHPSTSPARPSATQSEKPEEFDASAIAYPPPIRINTPHDDFNWTTFQFKIGRAGPLAEEFMFT